MTAKAIKLVKSFPLFTKQHSCVFKNHKVKKLKTSPRCFSLNVSLFNI